MVTFQVTIKPIEGEEPKVRHDRIQQFIDNCDEMVLGADILHHTGDAFSIDEIRFFSGGTEIFIGYRLTTHMPPTLIEDLVDLGGNFHQLQLFGQYTVMVETFTGQSASDLPVRLLEMLDFEFSGITYTDHLLDFDTNGFVKRSMSARPFAGLFRLYDIDPRY